MCDECGIRPANIRLTTIVNGEKKERNLCSECLAKNQKIKNDFSTLAGHLNNLFDVLKSDVVRAEEDVPDIECSRCGMTYERFRKGGVLGCAQCYRAFREPLQKMMNGAHGHIQHVGRSPGGVDQQLSVRLQIEKLRKEMNKAISEEEYENAAALRDQIRELEARLSGEAERDE